MGTVSVRMPDEEIEKLDKIAEREGKSRSAVLREFAEEKIEENSVAALEDLVGILSDEEAEEFKDVVEENRKKMTEDFEKRQERLFGE
ncbi:MAG: DUF6290 family protein [Candidatus Nanohalobium sp.]